MPYQCIGIQEDTFAIAIETPALQLCEGYSEVGTIEQLKMAVIATVQLIYKAYLIIN